MTPIIPEPRRSPLRGRFWIGWLAGLLSLAFGSPIVEAATINVPADQATIQAAVNAASTGDTIVVAAGTYSELVTVNKQLTLQGAQAGVDARTRAVPPASESVVNGLAGTTSFWVKASGVIIDGFTVELTTNVNQFNFGIWLDPTTHGSTITNTIVRGNIAGLGLSNNSAVAADQTVVTKNRFESNNAPGAASGTGIYADEYTAGSSLTNVLIDSNLFTGNTAEAIGLYFTTAGTSATGITISNNTFDGNRRGIGVLGLKDSGIRGNTFKNSTAADTADLRIFEGSSGLYDRPQHPDGRSRLRVSGEQSPGPRAFPTRQTST